MESKAPYLFMKQDILNFISRFNKFGNEVRSCFKERNCYYFYIILKNKFETAEPYYDKINDHVITKIDNLFYDIDGVYKVKETSNITRLEGVNNKIKQQL